MENVLSSLLTTIAASSASFVAIIGGFIASKLISVNGDREATVCRLSELDSEIDLKENEMIALNDEIIEDDALDYITDNIVDIVNTSDLEIVYDNSNHNLLSAEDLKPYWIRAQSLATEFHKCCEKGVGFNEDQIPNDMAMRVKNLPFEYEVCQAISREVFPHPLSAMLNTRTPGAWYERNRQKIQDLDLEIRSLKLQRHQHEERRKALKKPRGMKAGITLFALFSLCNIVFPLIASTLTLDDVSSLSIVRITAIGLLSIGLLATLVYLVWLLKWKTEVADKENV